MRIADPPQATSPVPGESSLTHRALPPAAFSKDAGSAAPAGGGDKMKLFEDGTLPSARPAGFQRLRCSSGPSSAVLAYSYLTERVNRMVSLMSIHPQTRQLNFITRDRKEQVDDLVG